MNNPPHVLDVVCGQHERPVKLGMTTAVAIVDGERTRRREQPAGTGVTVVKRDRTTTSTCEVTDRVVVWMCPDRSCLYELPMGRARWQKRCDELRAVGAPYVDITRLRR